jgi:hypothetical protein
MNDNSVLPATQTKHLVMVVGFAFHSQCSLDPPANLAYSSFKHTQSLATPRCSSPGLSHQLWGLDSGHGFLPEPLLHFQWFPGVQHEPDQTSPLLETWKVSHLIWSKGRGLSRPWGALWAYFSTHHLPMVYSMLLPSLWMLGTTCPFSLPSHFNSNVTFPAHPKIYLLPCQHFYDPFLPCLSP